MLTRRIAEAQDRRIGSRVKFVAQQAGRRVPRSGPTCVELVFEVNGTGPVVAAGGKVFFLEQLQFNIQSQAYYFVEKPDFGPDWQLRVQVQLLFPLPGS